ncbi:MAG TPA: Tn3 family transposase, partial [Candidatus Berkiella sp.]|nr:Tn3 family transposase [Candidatus Berkiella sp.]
LSDHEIRDRIYEIVGYDKLIHAVDNVSELIQPPDNVFYQELEQKKKIVKRFLSTLLHVITFDANQAGKSVVKGLAWLKSKQNDEPPMGIVSKSWKRYIYSKDGKINSTAYMFCVLDKLQAALKRRDVFVSPSWRYADPTANLHSAAEWEAVRPVICRSLNLSTDPKLTLTNLIEELDQAYQLVSANIDNNPSVRFETVKGNEELILTHLDKL